MLNFMLYWKKKALLFVSNFLDSSKLMKESDISHVTLSILYKVSRKDSSEVFRECDEA